ncbi:MAG: Holliday junction resolvase RecU [Sarcina sp.]
MAEKETVKRKSTHANRGMDFETEITNQCNKYIKQGVAYIFKLHTEFLIRRGKGGHIIGCIPKSKSLTDMFGVLSTGEAIAIEAKNTNNKTSFSLSNIKDHQFVFLEEWNRYTKHSYYLIRFKEHNEVYLVHSSKVQNFKDTQERKSIPYSWFQNEENATLLNGVDFLEKIELDNN